MHLPSWSTRLPIACDPIEDPAVGVLATNALSLVEQAPCSPGSQGRVLREQCPPPLLQRSERRGCLNRVTRQCPPSLAVELESPLHLDPLGDLSASLDP